MIPDQLADTVLVSDRLAGRYPDLFRRLSAVLAGHSVPLRQVAGTADVWIRDYAPLQIVPSRFVQFRYRPDYLRGHEHLITPQPFGVGWTVNVGRVVALVRKQLDDGKA